MYSHSLLHLCCLLPSEVHPVNCFVQYEFQEWSGEINAVLDWKKIYFQ